MQGPIFCTTTIAIGQLSPLPVSVAGHFDAVRILMGREAGIQLSMQWETSKGFRRLVTPPTTGASAGAGGTNQCQTLPKMLIVWTTVPHGSERDG